MPDVEHRVAVFWDANGRRNSIRFEELEDDNKFADAKLLELYDESEQVRVYPRDGSAHRRRHFYSESTGQRAFDGGEHNPAHDSRVADVLASLKRLKDGWSLAYQQVASESPLPVFGPLPAYVWDAEVTRIVGPRACVRHDIYGDWGIHMSVRRPAIAIEVVNTHYPEEATFEALLAQSAAIPLVVLFDFTRARRNQLVVVDEENQRVSLRSYTFSITDGSVWLGNERREDITTSARLRVAADKRYGSWK